MKMKIGQTIMQWQGTQFLQNIEYICAIRIVQHNGSEVNGHILSCLPIHIYTAVNNSTLLKLGQFKNKYLGDTYERQI